MKLEFIYYLYRFYLPVTVYQDEINVCMFIIYLHLFTYFKFLEIVVESQEQIRQIYSLFILISFFYNINLVQFSMFNNYSLFVYERIYLECLECIAICQEKCTFTYYLYQFIMRHSKNHVLFILKLFHPVYSVTNVSIHYLVVHYISQSVSLSPSYSQTPRHKLETDTVYPEPIRTFDY